MYFHMYFYRPPRLPVPVLSPLAPLTPDQIALLLQQALEWEEVKAEDVQAFVARFETTWGPLTLATLLHIAHYFAPDRLSGTGSEPVAISAPPQMALPTEAVGTEHFGVAEDVLVVLVGLGLALQQWQHAQQEGEGERARQPQPDAWSAEASAALVAYLDSPRPRERWISALWLGWLRDARAVPTLARMLTEYLPPHEVRDGDGDPVLFYEVWRPHIAPLISQMAPAGGLGLAVALRQALLAALAQEQAVPRPRGPLPTWSLLALGEREQERRPDPNQWTGQAAFQMYHSECQPWINYQHQLVYSLGRLGAFGALMGVPTPEGIYNLGAAWSGPGDDPSRYTISNAEVADHADRFRGNLWRVEACCGYLEEEYCARVNPYVSRIEDVPAFAQAVARLLEEQFGLTEAERRQAMEDYVGAGYFYDVTRYYEQVAQERAGRQQPTGNN